MGAKFRKLDNWTVRKKWRNPLGPLQVLVMVFCPADLPQSPKNFQVGSVWLEMLFSAPHSEIPELLFALQSLLPLGDAQCAGNPGLCSTCRIRPELSLLNECRQCEKHKPFFQLLVVDRLV